MAKTSPPDKPTKAELKAAAKAASAEAKSTERAAKAARKAEKKERRSQMWQAFKMQRKEDKWLLPIMIGAVVIVTAVIVGLGFLTKLWWFVSVPMGLLMGVMVAMILFARRVQKSVYKKAEGTPGAAAWALQNNLRGKWRVTPSVAGTTHMDAVHRVIGRPGVVLVGEGAPHRVKPLLAQEKKRLSRLVGSVPIYDIIIGHDEGQTPLNKLTATLMRLPRNIAPAQVSAIDSRLSTLSGRSPQMGLPKGPMPQGAKMRNIQRTMRRR